MNALEVRLADAADRLIESGILDDIFDAGWKHLGNRDMDKDAEAITRIVLNQPQARTK